MSVEQYRRSINSLDKEIADLEKKKAEADKKAADYQKKAAVVSISKNMSATTVKSKMQQIERYNADTRKAAGESADFAKKIADKRRRRNDEAIRLQKEEEKEQKKQTAAMKKMQESYESRIRSLQQQLTSFIPTSIPVHEKQEDDLSEFDVFISHAWEDKQEFVDEFVDALRSRGIKVWYDTSEIKWGDSMRKRIDDGLKKSRFGVAVLSPNYLAEGKYWTKAELDGLFQIESINGKTLLPIWHNLTKKEVMSYSPIIASKLAMTTATMTPDEIAAELVKILSDDEENNQ